MPITIDQVLSCKNLPSLPSVAVEVLAFTRDPNVPLEKIAKVIQNDAALTAKVLKTVNSSYYGLAQKCATLNRAIGYLGIKTVKSLVLGFCLVDSTRSVEEGGFDLGAYWKRGLYSATAARMLAGITGATDPDEAFTACLFQDIGMLACFAAMGKEYDAVLAAAPLSHDALAASERDALGFDHCILGSKFAEKWKPGLLDDFEFPPGRRDRSDFFRGELEELLLLSRREGVAASSWKGSYAGAIGWPQFMPGSINRWAVDFDEDGHIDLQRNVADAIGSVAHYLAWFGWRSDLPTHYDVLPPADAAERAALLAPDILPSFTPAQFEAAGAKLAAEAERHDGLLALVELHNGHAAPSYVAGTSNFYVVTRYNWSSSYAMAVIELAAAAAAAGDGGRRWLRHSTALRARATSSPNCGGGPPRSRLRDSCRPTSPKGLFARHRCL